MPNSPQPSPILSAAIGSPVGLSTVGSLLFVGAGNLLAQDNAVLFWDDANNRLGLGTNAPGAFLTVTQAAAGGGNPKGLLFSGGAHTGLGAGDETLDVNFNLSRTVDKLQGAVATQRAFLIQAPTYSFNGASTITNAATFAVTGAPAAGANATITNSYALWVQSGKSLLYGNVTLGDGTSATTVTNSAKTTITQPVSTSGNPTGLTFTGGAHTGLTATAETIDVDFNLARTVQHALGSIATQRAFLVRAPTYSFVAPSVIGSGATVAITGAPVAGANATITNSYALWVQSGKTVLIGDVKVGDDYGHDLYAASSLFFTNESGIGHAVGVEPSGDEIQGLSLDIYPGQGGNSAGGGDGGGGGNLNIFGNSGGDGDGGNAAGWGSEIYIDGGNAGSDGGGGGSTGGGIWVTGGSSSGSFAGGGIFLTGGGANDTGNGGPVVILGGQGANTGGNVDIDAGDGGVQGVIRIGTNSGTSITIGRAGVTQAFANKSFAITQSASTSGNPTGLLLTAGAHTSLTASAEVVDVNLNLARTVNRSTGAVATQRAMLVQAPTYSFVGPSTITNAATLAITGAPVAGANATITNSYPFWVQAGTTRFDGPISQRAHAGSDGDLITDTARVQTTNAVQTTLWSKSLSDLTFYAFEVRVIGRDSTGAKRAVYKITGSAYRQGGIAILGDTWTTVTDETPVDWNAILTVDGANVLRVSVTGEAATTINWVAKVEYQHVT